MSCSPWGAGQLIAHHDLPHYRIARKILVKKSEFDEWLAKYQCKDRVEELANEVLKELYCDSALKMVSP